MKKQVQSLVSLAVLATVVWTSAAQADAFTMTVTDQTPTEPLANPDPFSFQPRYISGFGVDDTFTVFFEDRDNGYRISYASTTTGPTGFATNATATNIADTHFVVKDWPITIDTTPYAYRGWGAVGNNRDHRFYVSNNLITWTLVSTFTIPNALGFANANGYVYYGFHDVIQLNGTYYAFGESNCSQTMIVSSTTGTDDWTAFASVGGRPGDGPLELPAGVAYGWTPSGNFFDLGHDRGYGKIHVDPRDNNLYLAINTAAQASLPPAELEAAFINPANWTWHDETTGPAANPILSATAEHDLRECWLVPSSDPDAGWVIVYNADFGSGDGGKALGYASSAPPPPPPDPVWVDDDWTSQADVNLFDPSLIWQYDAFNVIQDGINAVASSGTVNVRAGLYSPGPGGIRIDPDNLTIQSTDGPATTVISLTTSCANEGGIEIDGNGNTLDGFKVQDFSDNSCEDKLIRINGDHNVIKNNVLQGNLEQPGSYYQTTFAILDYGADTIIDSNEIYDIGLAGIHVGGPPHGEIGVVVSNNIIHNVMRRGIEIDRCPNAIVTQNTISDVVGGTLHGHPDYGSENVGIIVWGDSAGTVIVNQDLDGLPTGISLLATQGVTVSNCEISNMDNVGIRLEASNDYPYSQPPFVFDSHTIQYNTIRDNQYGIVIGDGNSWGIGNGNRIHHNRVYGNTTTGADNTSPTQIDAADNWWGCNEGPGTTGCDLASGSVDHDPWLVLGLTANPMSVFVNGGTSVLTASLRINSDGVDTSPVGHIPDGTTTIFTATLGTVTPEITGTIEGLAASAFVAGMVQGSSIVSATVDSETVTLTLTIDPSPAPPLHYIYLPLVQSGWPSQHYIYLPLVQRD